MRLTAGTIAGLGATFVAVAALAQPADPIGEILDRSETGEPDAAADAPPAGAVPGLPAAPQPYAPGPSDAAYESRIRASMASVRQFQGALDGGWTLAAPDGDLFAFQLVDRGTGMVEGAWRDLRRPGALDASGFVDTIERTGGELVLRFDAGTRTVRLRAGARGGWTGELVEPEGTRPVSLRR